MPLVLLVIYYYFDVEIKSQLRGGRHSVPCTAEAGNLGWLSLLV